MTEQNLKSTSVDEHIRVSLVGAPHPADNDTQLLIDDSTRILSGEHSPASAEHERLRSRSQIGSVLEGKYQLSEVIGEGGMGTVYKAWHLFLEQPIAVKILHPHLMSTLETVDRFIEEARTAHALKHPNLVSVFDFGFTENNEPFIVMEYVAGESLSDRLKRVSSLSIAEIAPIFAQISSALDYAHENNIVHRDIKPSNILLSLDGNETAAKLTDFGICKVLSEKNGSPQTLTHTGQIFGSPHYMSPEQCRGDIVDRRSDIYSLGVVIFECLTGRVPFMGCNPIDTLMMHCSEPVPKVVAKNKSRGFAKVKKIIERALQKEPKKRQQTARELHDELDALNECAGNSPAGSLSVKKTVKQDWRAFAVALTLVTFVWPAISLSRGERFFTDSAAEARISELLDLSGRCQQPDSENLRMKALEISDKHFGRSSRQSLTVIDPSFRFDMETDYHNPDKTQDLADRAMNAANRLLPTAGKSNADNFEMLDAVFQIYSHCLFRYLGMEDEKGWQKVGKKIEALKTSLDRIEKDLLQQLHSAQARHDKNKVKELARIIERIEHGRPHTVPDDAHHRKCLYYLDLIGPPDSKEKYASYDYWLDYADHLKGLREYAHSYWLRLKCRRDVPLPDLKTVKETQSSDFNGKWNLPAHEIENMDEITKCTAEIQQLANGDSSVKLRLERTQAETAELSITGKVRDGTFHGKKKVADATIVLDMLIFGSYLICNLDDEMGPTPKELEPFRRLSSDFALFKESPKSPVAKRESYPFFSYIRQRVHPAFPRQWSRRAYLLKK